MKNFENHVYDCPNCGVDVWACVCDHDDDDDTAPNPSDAIDDTINGWGACYDCDRYAYIVDDGLCPTCFDPNLYEDDDFINDDNDEN